MIRFLKSLSRTVHEEHHNDDERKEEDGGGGSTSLTVWRKSLCVGCNGFTVIDTHGNLVYRVDNYIGHRPDEIILMDASGKPILTVSRSKQKLRLVDNWLVYDGEGGGYCATTKSLKKPICCARRHMNILQPNVNRLARVFRGPSDKNSTYVIEGSYAHRSCKILDESRTPRRVVAEIRKKEYVMKGISFGVEVFVLIVRPGFNPGFAMAIVLLLDQKYKKNIAYENFSLQPSQKKETLMH